LIWGDREAIYFRCDGWTGFCESEVICPSGSHTAHHIANERRCEHAIQRTSKHGVATSSLRAKEAIHGDARRSKSSGKPARPSAVEAAMLEAIFRPGKGRIGKHKL
jgi:hypothetical protein